MSEHGTRSRYTNHGCRCEACQEANRAYVAAHRARTAVRRPGRPRLAIEHGLAGWRRGCRCDVCRAGREAEKEAAWAAEVAPLAGWLEVFDDNYVVSRRNGRPVFEIPTPRDPVYDRIKITKLVEPVDFSYSPLRNLADRRRVHRGVMRMLSIMKPHTEALLDGVHEVLDGRAIDGHGWRKVTLTWKGVKWRVSGRVKRSVAKRDMNSRVGGVSVQVRVDEG